MNPEVKTKWIEALRSGKYQQSTGRLHRASGFCCLGVLCDLAVKDGLPVDVVPSVAGDFFYYDGSNGTLPKSVVDWAGLNRSDPVLRPDDPDQSWRLSDINDRGTSFAEIANLIEEQL